MTDTDTTVIELSPEQLQWIMQFLEAQAQDSPGPVIKSIVEAYVCLVVELSKKRVNIRRLQRLLFSARTEKTATVLGGQTGVSPATPPEETPSAEASVPSTETPPRAAQGPWSAACRRLPRCGQDACTASHTPRGRCLSGL